MPTELTAHAFLKELGAIQSPEQAHSHRHLKSNDSDVIMGARMGSIFALAKTYIGMPLSELDKMLQSPIHEMRVGALSIMDKQARQKKITPDHKKALYDLYLKHHSHINNWDLVDLAAINVIGGYLFDKPRDHLYTLARSSDTWERRTAILSTAYFIRHGQTDDTFNIADVLINDPHDFVHKATGWMLREASKQDSVKLRAFLDKYAATMPRVTLRYAIEHFDKDERDHYMNLKKRG